MFWLLTTIYFPREFEMFFSSFESGVWTHTANIWERSTRHNPLCWLNYSHETAHTTSLISPSKSSSSSNTSNSDTTSFILNERETRFASGIERGRSDPSRSFGHQEIFEPQPGNFGWMDRAHYFQRVTTERKFRYTKQYSTEANPHTVRIFSDSCLLYNIFTDVTKPLSVWY